MPDFIDEETRERLLYVIRQLSGRGGHTEDEETAREALVGAQAYAASFGATSVARSAAELFANTSEETLDEWERALSLPNDIARSTSERRERLVSVLAATGGDLYAIDRAASVLPFRADPILLKMTADDAQLGESQAIYQTAVILDEDDFQPSAVSDTAHERKALEVALQRALPAHALGQHTRGSRMDKAFASARGARWASAAAADGNDGDLGEVVLDANPPQIGLTETQRYPVRKTSFAQLTRLDAEELKTIERSLSWHASQNDALATTGLSTQGVGGSAIWFNFQVAASSTVTVHSAALDDSLVQVYAAGGTSGTRRPGQANDGNPGDVRCFSDVWFTGNSTSYRSKDFADASATYTGSYFVWNPAIGIQFVNAEASPMEVWGFMMIGPGLGARAASPSPSNTDTPNSYLDGASGATFTGLTWLAGVRAAYFGKASGTTSGGGVDAGGVRRVGVLTGVQIPSSGTRNVVLDTTEDWRDRIVVFAFATPDGDQVRPGITGDHNLDLSLPFLFFSGPGKSAFGAGGYEIEINGGDFGIWVDEDSGALMLSLTSAITEAAIGLSFLVIGTEQLGFHIGPIARIETAFGTTGNRIEPRQLNFPQDCGFYEQVGQGRPGNHLLALPLDSECMPLGPDGDGSPIFPFSWMVRQSSPIAGNDGKRHVRQRLADSLRFFQAVAVPNSPTDWTYLYTKQDDIRDLRDRFGIFNAAWSTSNILPGQASDTTIHTATKFSKFIWTGPISGPTGSYAISLATNLAMGIVSTIGGIQRLAVRNTTGSTLYMIVMCELGPRLGLRDSV